MLFQDAPVAEPDLTVVSLGGGIQSTALCLMADQGLFHRKPDVAIFADTGWEPPHVYATIEALQGLLSYPVEVVSNGRNLKEDVKAGVQAQDKEFIVIPAFILAPSGKKAVAFRQCTNQYKIAPIERKIRELLGYSKGQRIKKGTYVETWMGISTDEYLRAKDNRTWFIHNRYPLLDNNLSRQDCQLWMVRNFPDVPVGKSACYGCPYHSNAQWQKLSVQYPDLMEETFQIDEGIRNNSRMGKVFLHQSRIPLRQAVKQTGSQDSLDLETEECDGVCFF